MSELDKIRPKVTAKKILNELKYNKRLIYLWEKLTDESQSSEDYISYLIKRIEKVIFEIQNPSNDQKIFKKKPEVISLLKEFKPVDMHEVKNEDYNFEIILFDKESQISTDNISYNEFILLDIDNYILSALWVETVGKYIDHTLNSNVYANRVSNTDNRFFKYYFSSYNEYRDNSFNEMKYLVDNSNEGLAIQLDIKKCFYNVDIDLLKGEVEELINTMKHGSKSIKTINEGVFNIIYEYNYLINNGVNELLPIGFLPSNILINLYLQKLDSSLKQELNPISYGRYVDDITLLIKKDINKSTIKEEINEISNQLDNCLEKAFVLNNEAQKNESKKIKIKFNNDKKIFFVITKESDQNYIKKFQSSIERLSSDFYRLIDVNEIDSEINAAYDIVLNPVKLKDFSTINKDKKAINRLISSVFHTLFSEPIADDAKNKKLAKIFVKKINKFIDVEFFFLMFDYWLYVILIELVSWGKDYRAKLKVDQFNKLTIISKLKEYQSILLKNDVRKDKNPKKFVEFTNHYLNLFEKIFLENSKQYYLKSILDYYTIPIYLNSEYILKMNSKKENTDFYEGMLTYENQLHKLYEIFEEKGDKNNITNHLSQFNMIAEEGLSISSSHGKMENITNNNDQVSESSSFLDFNILNRRLTKRVKISQVSINNTDNRFEKFLKLSINTDKLSDLTKSLNKAKNHNTDILVFPEQALNFTDIYKLINFSRKNKITIIGGFDYILLNNKVLNITFAIIPFDFKYNDNTFRDCATIIKPKRYPAPIEYNMFNNSRCQRNPSINREMYVPKTEQVGISFKVNGITHCVLNCYELTDLKTKANLSELKPDIVHVVANNKDVNYFDSIGEVVSRELMVISTITNYAKSGGTQVFIPYKERYKQLKSYHKGSEELHLFTNTLNVNGLKNKRFNNNDNTYRQNPPSIYYENIFGSEFYFD